MNLLKKALLHYHFHESLDIQGRYEELPRLHISHDISSSSRKYLQEWALQLADSILPDPSVELENAHRRYTRTYWLNFIDCKFLTTFIPRSASTCKNELFSLLIQTCQIGLWSWNCPQWTHTYLLIEPHKLQISHDISSSFRKYLQELQLADSVLPDPSVELENAHRRHTRTYWLNLIDCKFYTTFLLRSGGIGKNELISSLIQSCQIGLWSWKCPQ